MKYPFAPLEPLIEDCWRPTTEQRMVQSSMNGKAHQVTGIRLETIARWRREGLPPFAADRMACALGFHPGLVWPEWWQQ